jgi:hypothetical protein
MAMSSIRRWGLVILISLAIGVALGTFQVRAPGSRVQTIPISRDYDDGFVTPAGIGIRSALVHLLDPNMDITSWVFFHEIDIDGHEPLDNATLTLTSASTLPFDADSSVTVYGVYDYDLQGLGAEPPRMSPADILGMPLTQAFVNVNTSQFYGGATLDIDVTDIVQEIKTHPHWDGDGFLDLGTGDSMMFIILGAEDETRYFYSYREDPARSASLEIGYNSQPPPPPGYPDATYNGTYRGSHIWIIPGLGSNRTGLGFDVNWNLLNLTSPGMTETDANGDIVINNATMATITSWRKDAISSYWNDSGVADIDTFFMRYRINVTAVNNPSAVQGNPIVLGPGLSTVAPNLANGMAYGVGGDWIGLMGIVDTDDNRFRVWIRERTGPADQTVKASYWIGASEMKMLYIELYVNMTAPFIGYNIYNDPEFTDLNRTRDHVPTLATGPFRYVQALAGMGQAVEGGAYSTFTAFTYLTMPVASNDTYRITDENGTDTTCGLLLTEEEAKACIDQGEGGPDPQEANPPGQDWPTEGPFTRFRMRSYFFLVGFFCFWGPIWFFSWKRPSGYYLLVGALIMLTGLGLMAQVAFV